MLSSGSIRRVDRSGGDAAIAIGIPDLARRVSAGDELRLILRRCTKLQFQSWEADGEPIEDAERLSAMQLEVLGVFTPPDELTYAYVLVKNRKREPRWRGGRLFVEADDVALEDSAGRPVAAESLTHALAEETTARLRSKPLAAHKKVFDAIVHDVIAPLLASAGFSKQGKTFVRVDGRIAKLLKVEASRFNTAHSFSFGLLLQMLEGDLPSGEKTTESTLRTQANAFYSRPIAALWAQPGELYSFTTEMSAMTLGPRIRDDLLRYVLPFCARFVTVDDALALLKEKNRETASTQYSLVIATILARAGKKDESRAYFLESLTPRNVMRKIAAFYGVDIDD